MFPQNKEPFPQIRIGPFGMFYAPGNGQAFWTITGPEIVMALLQYAPWNMLRLGDRTANDNR